MHAFNFKTAFTASVSAKRCDKTTTSASLKMFQSSANPTCYALTTGQKHKHCVLRGIFPVMQTIT